MTFATIRTRVLTRVIDTPTAVQTEVPTLVNEAMRTLQSRHNFKVMEKIGSYITAEGVRVLAALPSDFKEFRGEPWNESFLGTIWPMTVAANLEGTIIGRGGFDPLDTGRPRVLVDSEAPADDATRNWEIYPLSDGNSDYVGGEYRIKVPYWRYLPALVADAATNWFTTNAEEYLVFKATAEAFALDWDFQSMAVWETKADVKFKEVVRADKLYRMSAVRDFVPFQSGNDPRLRL